MFAAVQRWGGVLVRPRATFEAFHAAHSADPRVGKWDAWALTGLYVAGSQVQAISEALAKYQAFDSLAILFNGVAMAVLAPILVGFLAEALLGARHRAYGNMTLVPLVALATVANLLRQQGVQLPGPHYLPEMMGSAWAVALAFWGRARLPKFEAESPKSKSKSKSKSPADD